MDGVQVTGHTSAPLIWSWAPLPEVPAASGDGPRGLASSTEGARAPALSSLKLTPGLSSASSPFLILLYLSGGGGKAKGGKKPKPSWVGTGRRGGRQTHKSTTNTQKRKHQNF